MKVIVTTSNNYHHCVEIFIKLFNREWKNARFDLVGYNKPKFDLPENCNWISLGIQRGPKYFSTDLRPYFEKQPQYFIWLFEDSLLKSVDHRRLNYICKLPYRLSTWEWIQNKVGRFCLSREGMNRKHTIKGDYWYADPDTNYRLSTQPSIWNKTFLMQYLKPGLDPWQFEKQPTYDDWEIIGPIKSIVEHNEGVTKKDIHKLNLEGITL